MSRETQAQALLLESVLTQTPLPGLDRVLAFPDLGPLAGDDGEILLVDDRDPSELDLPARVRVVGSEEMDAVSAREGLTPVLEFLPPEAMEGKVSVRLRLSRAGGGQTLPLGEIVATFADRDPLTAVDPTHVLAY